jgi:hypothetical protein
MNPRRRAAEQVAPQLVSDQPRKVFWDSLFAGGFLSDSF